jgi:hypothetical protein
MLYAINENSVLIMSEEMRNVGVRRLGKNIQPVSAEECGLNIYICNSCERKTKIRYICMSCQIDPQ